MRFPVSQTDRKTNETLPILDHQLVFQLADYLNNLNKNDSAWAVKFIPWIESNPATPAQTSKRMPDGTVPTKADIALNPALADNATATLSNSSAVEYGNDKFLEYLNLNNMLEKARLNVFRAHKEAIAAGLFDFSEAGYLRYVLGLDANITDQVANGSPAGYLAFDNPAFLTTTEYVYFTASKWRTIDQGLSRLPNAFTPLVSNRTRFNTKVESLTWNSTTKKVTLAWRDKPFSKTTTSLTADYAVISAPFTKLRLWRLPPYSSLLSRAIASLNYDTACKVALHFRTRFWEHLPKPIFGGCGSVDIPIVGFICYPSYNLNGTGPGVLLASYVTGPQARAASTLSEEEHAAYILRAIEEVHGKVASEQFTGQWNRVCWEAEADEGGGWASPLVGQQELYLPAYFRTEFGSVFVGEHTTYTHAWIWSALESAVRGTVQLLLEMGLVDEAKSVTASWMGRWIEV